jgi:hypothetical protein
MNGDGECPYHQLPYLIAVIFSHVRAQYAIPLRRTQRIAASLKNFITLPEAVEANLFLMAPYFLERGQRVLQKFARLNDYSSLPDKVDSESVSLMTEGRRDE